MSVFYRDIDVKISDYKSELSKPLIVYERDRGLEIYFNLIEYAYRFDKNPTNLLDNLVGAYATVTLVNPSGDEIRVNEVEITEDAKVKFVITEDLTDELTEIGTYQLQIHVNNDVEGRDTSVFSIPPFNFEVRERLKGRKNELLDAEGNGLTDKEGYQLLSASSSKVINFSTDEINKRLSSVSTIQGEIKNLNSQLDTNKNKINNIIVDDTSSIKRAIDYSISIGSKNIKIANGEYLIKELCINSSINLIFENASIIRPKDTYSIFVDYHSDDIRNVTNLSNEHKAKLYMNDTNGIKRGDIIKVFSDDLIPNVRNTSKNGEFKVVYDVKSEYILVCGELKNTYTTNVKIVKVSDKKFSLKGATLKAINNTIGEITLPVIQVLGGKYHDIQDIIIDDVSDTGIKMIGCYGYNAKIHSKYQANGETYGESVLKIGYGLLDIAGDSYNVTFNSNNCRHPFDTNQGGTMSNTYGEACGVTRNGIIHDSISNGGSYSGINVHEDTDSVEFNNVIVKNNIRQGATLRGENLKLKNCVIEGKYGLNSGNYSGNADKKTTNIGNHIISNCIIKATDTALIGDGADVKSKITFYNCVIEGKITYKNYEVEFDNCKLNFKDTNLTNTNMIFNNCHILKEGSFSLINSDIHFNYTKIESKGADLFQPTGTGSVNVDFNNSIIDWNRCTSVNRNSIFILTTDQEYLDLNINWISTTFIPSTLTPKLYIGYISGKTNTCLINGFNSFIYPRSGVAFNREPWSNKITVENISYAPSSLELT